MAYINQRPASGVSVDIPKLVEQIRDKQERMSETAGQRIPLKKILSRHRIKESTYYEILHRGRTSLKTAKKFKNMGISLT